MLSTILNDKRPWIFHRTHYRPCFIILIFLAAYLELKHTFRVTSNNGKNHIHGEIFLFAELHREVSYRMPMTRWRILAKTTFMRGKSQISFKYCSFHNACMRTHLRALANAKVTFPWYAHSINSKRLCWERCGRVMICVHPSTGVRLRERTRSTLISPHQSWLPFGSLWRSANTTSIVRD